MVHSYSYIERFIADRSMSMLWFEKDVWKVVLGANENRRMANTMLCHLKIEDCVNTICVTSGKIEGYLHKWDYLYSLRDSTVLTLSIKKTFFNNIRKRVSGKML